MVPHTRKKERRVICKEFGMKLIAITFLTVTAAFAQTAESPIPVTDAEKTSSMDDKSLKRATQGPSIMRPDPTEATGPSPSGG